MPTEIMTVQELADYLKLNPQTVYRKFRKGELPGVKIGAAVRFKREVIDSWLRAMSHGWSAERRAELRGWAASFATARGVQERDALRAVNRRRRGS